jgi:hypothetical protein
VVVGEWVADGGGNNLALCFMPYESRCTKRVLQIDSVDQKLFKFQSTMWGNFSQGTGTPGTQTQRDIAFSQLAVKGLISL